MVSLRMAVLFLVPSVAFAGAVASAFRPEHRKGANYYNAPSAIDNNPDTAWVVPGESPNRGEWIMLDVPKGTVDKIGMNIGWIKDDEHFEDYARIKQVKIEAFSLDDQQQTTAGASTTAEFADTQEWQVVDIDNLDVGQDLFGGKIKIHVVDIYDGKDYPNLAVSEVLLYLTEFDTQLNLLSSSDDVGGNAVANMQDDNARTFWATAAEGASFMVEAPGFGVSTVGIQAGPKSYARPKTVEITANNRSLRHVMEDNAEMQWLLVPTITGYTGGAFGEIEVKILDTYPGTESALAIAETAGRASNYEGF